MSLFLCVTHGTMALGETYVLVQFARELAADGHEVEFLAAPYATRFIEQSGFRCYAYSDSRKDNDQLIERYQKEKRPDIILMADYYFFYLNARLRQTVDVSAFFKSGIPVGVFESGNFYVSGTHGKFRNAFTHFSTNVALPRLPNETAFLLKSCPPHNPGTHERNVHRYALRKEMTPVDPDLIARTREAVGCPPGALLVVWPVPGYIYELRWAPRLQELGFDRKGLSIVEVPPDDPRREPRNNWYYHVNRLVLSYLEDLDVPVHVVNLSQHSEAYAGPPRGRITVKNLDTVAFEEFDRLLLSADFYFIDNRFSTTLSRAFFFPALTFCLVNSLAIIRGHRSVEPSFPLTGRTFETVKEIDSRHPRAIKPSHYSHIGWKSVFEGLVRGNPFTDTYLLLDLFKDEESVALLRRAARDPEVREGIRRAKEMYLSQIRTLPGPAEVGRNIVQNAVR